jgi:transposase InsO family protein
MAQRAPLTQAEKDQIVEKKAAGINLRQISEILACSFETVRKWWRLKRDQRPVRARGRPKGGPLSTYPQAVREKAIELKRNHPHWGPKIIRLKLEGELSLEKSHLPSAARLSVLFKQACPDKVQSRQARLPPPPNPTVTSVHQRWQMDAKEGLPVGSERVNVQEIHDKYSGLMIVSQAVVTTLPGEHWRHLHREEHQQVLRRAFSLWGLPLEVQTDNDGEFVNIADPTFPSPFTLWLVGLGIIHVLSRPRRPTDQAQVERQHRSQGDFVWKDRAFDRIEALQEALDDQIQLYNYAFPSQAAHCQGRPPLSVFPTAGSTGRPYHPALEWELFDMQRVDTFLAQLVWTRKVARNGVVHIADACYSLGTARKGQSVAVRFLPASRSFRFESADGAEIMVLPALGLEKEHLIGTIPAHLPLPVGFQFAFPLLEV